MSQLYQVEGTWMGMDGSAWPDTTRGLRGEEDTALSSPATEG